MAQNGGGPVFESELSKSGKSLKEMVGEESLVQFRDDIRRIFIKNVDSSGATQLQKRRWVHQGRQGLDDTRSLYISFDTGLDFISLFGWGFSLILAAGANELLTTLGVPSIPSIVVSAAMGLLLYGLNTGLIVAKALVNEVAYPNERLHQRLAPSELRFRAGWNRGVIQSGYCLGGLVLWGLITSPDSAAYQHGLRFMDWYSKRRF